MIDQLTVDKIIDATQIVDVVSEFVTLRKRGVNYVGLCPFHNDKTPSFSVSPSKGLCKCFSCGKGGNAVHFIMEHEQLNYYNALKFLAKKYHIEVNEREQTDSEKLAQNERESLFIVNGFAKDYFQTTLHNHLEGKSIGLPYFNKRGFREDIVRKFELGYCTEQKDGLSKAALNQGYKLEYLVKTGLCFEGEHDYIGDRFRGRVLFPVHTLSGKVVAFGGRTLKSDPKVAKYVNSPESIIYHKSNELYGIYFAKQAIVKADKCFLVEGYTDVISMHQSGIENVVASSGTALTVGQIRLIRRFTNHITVLYDGDTAGIKASIRGIDLLLEESMNIKVLLLPPGADPDSFAKEHNATELVEYIKANEVDFIQFKVKLLIEDAGRDPHKMAELITDIVRTISVIKEEIIRSVYIKECSQLLHIEEQILLNAVQKNIKSVIEKPVRPIPSGATEPPTDEHQTSDPPLFQTESQFSEYEYQILRILIKYGDSILFQTLNEADEPVVVTVIEYIASDLAVDKLELSSPIHQQILQEALDHHNEAGFVSQRYFLNHSQLEISELAADLVSVRYQLSKSMAEAMTKEEDHLLHIVPRLMVNLKNVIIFERIKQLEEQLKNPDNYTDATIYNSLLEEYKQLSTIRSLMAKKLGDRVVLK